MSSQSSITVPAGQSPPFAVVTPDDHEAYILISTAFGLACILFFAGIRTVVRTTISHGIGLDDYLFYAGSLLAIIQSSIVLGACSKGLGKALHLVSLERQHEIQKMTYAGNLFFIIIIGLSKISIVSFLHRISRMKQHRLVFNIAMGILGLWTVGSFLAIAFQCDLSHAWLTVNQKCPGVFRRWQVIGVLDIVTEVGIICLVAYLVHDLQTSVSSKMTVLSIFGIRLFLIIFIAFRLHTFSQSGYTTNPLLREATFAAWTQSELSYSLVSATMPIFHNFLKSLSTGFGGMHATSHGYGYGSGTGSRAHGQDSKGFQLSMLRSKNKSAAMPSMNDDRDEFYGQAKAMTAEQLGGAPAASTTVQWSGGVRGSNGETTSINSDESQRYMIRKDVQWEVRTELRE
ncbi:uncharacterized protein Z520_00692 [Fonsecaea multimorphosa CBS 102226]|uniref:Rhodopsin domain-containing protein n=1 Tax=Fonsecaea multimorphosa CBS 102226 TaxID=1442371 RepID=A0A0D2KKJ9_9EURO|nr:uncharacterized protein Z520_00692 [Fonsecaea multimorphosa CBS 102226]KIY04000.1 hypothetical protein Z520_00692 [Fonsecaea multimorphosa CBS 102226]OAL31838.1 hypothetical protein AYO22_00708 [Fonsecaea multimorphosa]